MTVNPHPPILPPELIEYYRGLPPATIGHVIDEGFVDTVIRPLYRRIKVVGTAVTLKLPEDDISLARQAIAQLQPGDVLVVDQGGETQAACWGEMTSLAARVRGCVGVIVDGTVTDAVEIEEQGMPTFSRAIAALVGHPGDGSGGGVNVSVQCGGVAVHPGDLVVADDNGIVVIPPQRATDVAARARAEEDAAPYQRIWLQRGGSFAEMSGKDAPTLYSMLQQCGWT